MKLGPLVENPKFLSGIHATEYLAQVGIDLPSGFDPPCLVLAQDPNRYEIKLICDNLDYFNGGFFQGWSIYNLSDFILTQEGELFAFARLESRDDEYDYRTALLKFSGKIEEIKDVVFSGSELHFNLLELFPVNLQDPQICKLNGTYILSGVDAKENQKAVMHFYSLPDIRQMTKAKLLFKGVEGMKNIRIRALQRRKDDVLCSVTLRPTGYCKAFDVDCGPGKATEGLLALSEIPSAFRKIENGIEVKEFFRPNGRCPEQVWEGNNNSYPLIRKNGHYEIVDADCLNSELPNYQVFLRHIAWKTTPPSSNAPYREGNRRYIPVLVGKDNLSGDETPYIIVGYRTLFIDDIESSSNIEELAKLCRQIDSKDDSREKKVYGPANLLKEMYIQGFLTLNDEEKGSRLLFIGGAGDLHPMCFTTSNILDDIAADLDQKRISRFGTIDAKIIKKIVGLI
ncbi:MAG: DUF1861 family protein [SAR324 cluster bacterium]|uniref:DUF1861 family protein n=1 Tax=SAR324 cluster bacterium TaxID=2024889 RepID=A0A7X9FRR4_9DELT|nr:DUF1861 family protein [SAR324 cluster bacterium]